MDNKRVLIAVVASMAVLLLWGYFFPQPATQQAPQQTTETSQASAPAAQPFAEKKVPRSFTETPGRQVTVNTPEYVAVFNTAGGVLEGLSLKGYKEGIQPNSPDMALVDESALPFAPLGLIWEQNPTWSQAKWSFEGNDLEVTDAPKELVFVGQLGEKLLRRTLTFTPGTYAVDEALEVVNQGPEEIDATLFFTLAAARMTDKDDRYNQTRIAYLTPDKLSEEKDTDDLAAGVAVPDARWGGIESNYFLVAGTTRDGAAQLKAKFEDDVYRVALGRQVAVGPGAAAQLQATYYFGPKDAKALAGLPNDMQAALRYGFFDIIAKPLIVVLNFFYTYVHNYGVAIILLTVLIKILFWPLSQKSYKSMNKMKKLQPMMAKIREKYKDDRQKMNQEMMQLYKTYKVNPAGGCLPMLLQIPVFFALYQALLGSIELRHAAFITYLPFTDIIWLADLSAKDPLYITPLVMGATMFLQQKMTPAPGDPTQAKIMMFMPVIFTFLFLNFPSGLVVYWLVNNVLSIAQQWLLLRKAS